MKDLIKNGIKGNNDSINLLFSQFIDQDEEIINSEYLGINGLWHFGFHSFGCITDRRVCTIKVGWMGYVGYRDAFLEDVNSIEINQPSLILLYLLGIIFIISTAALYTTI